MNGTFNITSTVASSPIWIRLAEQKFGPTITSANHHALFLEYVDVFVTALWELNGEKGDKKDYEYYEYYAHLIINTQEMADKLNEPMELEKAPWLAFLGLENFDINSLQHNWDNNILSIYGYNIDCI